MLTRVAVFEGAMMLGGEGAFFTGVEARLEPMWRGFPHVQAVRVLRMVEADPGALPVVPTPETMVLEMDFAGMDDIRDCLASDIKTKAHAATLEVLQPFTGRFFHFITHRTLGGVS